MTFDEYVKSELEFDARIRTLLPPMPDNFEPYIRVVASYKKSDITILLTSEILEQPQALAMSIKTMKQALWQDTEMDVKAADKLYLDREKINKEYFGQ